MGLFDFFRPKRNEKEAFFAYADKVQKTLFPNGSADLEAPGVKIKEVMRDRMTQEQCEAYYAAVCTQLTISHLSGKKNSDRAEDMLARTAGVYLTENELAEIGLIVLKKDHEAYGANAGCSIDKAIAIEPDSAGSYTHPMHQILTEIFGDRDKDWFMDRASTVKYRGVLHMAIRVLAPGGSYNRVYFEYKERG